MADLKKCWFIAREDGAIGVSFTDYYGQRQEKFFVSKEEAIRFLTTEHNEILRKVIKRCSDLLLEANLPF